MIDTNAVIDLISGFLPLPAAAWLDEVIEEEWHALSVVTRIELFSKPASASETATMQALMASSLVFDLDEPIIQATIQLRQQYRRKLPDAIIAATALVHNLTLVTRNVADFRTITGLRVLDPYDVAGLPVG